MSAWNSSTAQSIRGSILDGSFTYCNRNQCPLIIGGRLPHRDSIRSPELRSYIQNAQTSLPTTPKVLALSNDRSCNLSCPSCRNSIISITGDKYREMERFQQQLLDSGLDDVELLIVAGSGDPFGSPLYRKLLASLDADRYPKLTVMLMTNGQRFTRMAWDAMHKINRAIRRVAISIDAASDGTYRILRRGGELPTLLDNLQFISDLRQGGALDYLELSFVVQRLNYKEVPDFVRLGKRFKVDRVSFALIADRGTYDSEAFDAQAVHRPAHPEHSAFLEVMRDAVIADPIVFAGTMTAFIPARTNGPHP